MPYSDVPFALATIRSAGMSVPVIRIGETMHDLRHCSAFGAAFDGGLMSLFEDWAKNEDILLRFAADISAGTLETKALDISRKDDDFLAPLLYPRKVIGFGANYYDHVRIDAGMENFTKEGVNPPIFLRSPTTTLVGSGRSVRYPTQSTKLDWEIELAVVIGRGGRRLTIDEASSAVAGYTIAIDLSARDWQTHPANLFKMDLFGGKNFDDSCPIGPWIVPARFVDARNLELKLSVNGELKQHGNTRDMVWSIEEQIGIASRHTTLEPGDILLTGTPAGCGMANGTFLSIGDEIEATIEPLGTLRVEIGPDRD